MPQVIRTLEGKAGPRAREHLLARQGETDGQSRCRKDVFEEADSRI